MKLVSKHGKVKGLGEYKVGTEVKLQVTPDKGYNFVEWSDGVKDNPRTIVVQPGENKYIPMYSKIEEPKVEEPKVEEPKTEEPEEITEIVVEEEVEAKPKKTMPKKKATETTTEE